MAHDISRIVPAFFVSTSLSLQSPDSGCVEPDSEPEATDEMTLVSITAVCARDCGTGDGEAAELGIGPMRTTRLAFPSPFDMSLSSDATSNCPSSRQSKSRTSSGRPALSSFHITICTRSSLRLFTFPCTTFLFSLILLVHSIHHPRPALVLAALPRLTFWPLVLPPCCDLLPARLRGFRYLH